MAEDDKARQEPEQEDPIRRVYWREAEDYLAEFFRKFLTDKIGADYEEKANWLAIQWVVGVQTHMERMARRMRDRWKDDMLGEYAPIHVVATWLSSLARDVLEDLGGIYFPEEFLAGQKEAPRVLDVYFELDDKTDAYKEGWSAIPHDRLFEAALRYLVLSELWPKIAGASPGVPMVLIADENRSYDTGIRVPLTADEAIMVAACVLKSTFARPKKTSFPQSMTLADLPSAGQDLPWAIALYHGAQMIYDYRALG